MWHMMLFSLSAVGRLAPFLLLQYRLSLSVFAFEWFIRLFAIASFVYEVEYQLKKKITICSRLAEVA